MLTTGKGTHYCVWCGFDMKSKEERECVACDGDLCQPRKRAAKTAPKKKPRPPKKREHVARLVAGVEGMAFYINDYRVAGPKPWGGGVTRHEFTFTDADLVGAGLGPAMKGGS